MDIRSAEGNYSSFFFLCLLTVIASFFMEIEGKR